ncbi:phosphoesterase [Lysobacteraceae bacterium NML93-0399]|nr:phosphoesterase [Xanthomonadaceae bacterium NML93-0399]
MSAPRLMGLALAVTLALAGPAFAKGDVEPNTLVGAGQVRYVADAFPDRIVASPAQDAATGFSVAWRTAPGVEAPVLEIAPATDSPDITDRRRIVARSAALDSDNGPAATHRADIDGLQPDTLYVWRVAGDDTWSPWMQTRTAPAPGAPLTLLYFGDTQNKNASLSTRVLREAQRHAPDATLALHAGDLVSGGDCQDDIEWGEWFDAMGPLSTMVLNAPATGNHEYWEEFEDTPQERRVLGDHWTRTFALPANGAPGAESTTYWFEHQDVRVVMLDGTSALDLGTAQAQAAWLDATLSASRKPWNIVVVHQPMYSPRQDRDNVELRTHVLPVLERHRVDLVLQGHDHVYGRRGGEVAGQATPQYVLSVAGAKQYRLSDGARRDMDPTAEDTQLFQVIRIDGDTLHFEARTVTGRLYDAFELSGTPGARRLREIEDGRIPQRDCERAATLKGRTDRCWE